MSSPNQIYTVDETGLSLDHNIIPPKVVTQRGHKKVRCQTSGNKSQITIIGCVSATEQAVLKLMLIGQKERFQALHMG